MHVYLTGSLLSMHNSPSSGEYVLLLVTKWLLKKLFGRNENCFFFSWLVGIVVQNFPGVSYSMVSVMGQFGHIWLVANVATHVLLRWLMLVHTFVPRKIAT